MEWKKISENLGLKRIKNIEDLSINKKYLRIREYDKYKLKEYIVKSISTKEIKGDGYFSNEIQMYNFENGSEKIFEFNKRIFDCYNELQRNYQNAFNNLINNGENLFLKEVEIGNISEKVINKVKIQTIKFLKEELKSLRKTNKGKTNASTNQHTKAP